MSLLVLFSSVRKAHILSFVKGTRVLFFAERKERKEAASIRLDRWCEPKMYSVGSRHVFAYRRGTQATAEHAERASSAIRQFAPAGAGFPAAQSPPHGEWWPVRALRALQHLSSRGYALSSRSMRVRDGSLGESFGAFLLSEKSTYLSPLIKEKRVLFFAERIKAVFIAIFCYLCYYEQNHYQ